MNKYNVLKHYLENIEVNTNEITLTFTELERILGFELPNSAYVHRPWWANPSSLKQHPYAQSWITAGWKVDSVNQEQKWVRFLRVGSAHPKSLNSKSHKGQSENSRNPSKGKQFQIISGQILSRRFSIDFQLEYTILIGDPPKAHKFDLVSSDRKYMGECKNYSWTNTGNVPSAKMGFTNEAVFYLTFLPKEKYRFVIMRKDTHPKRSETLAEYYYRTNKHLLQGVHILELDLETGIIREISNP